MYDAIVVGARCAGSPTAMLLARKGLRVLLVDKAHFPSDTLSTHYIHQPGVAAPEALGAPPPDRAVGLPAHPPVHARCRAVRARGHAAAHRGCRRGLLAAPLRARSDPRRGSRRGGRRGAPGVHGAGAADRRRARRGHPWPLRDRRAGDREGADRDRRRRHELARGAQREGHGLQRRARADVRLLHLLERSRDGGRRALSATRANDRRLTHQRRTSGDDRLLAK